MIILENVPFSKLESKQWRKFHKESDGDALTVKTFKTILFIMVQMVEEEIIDELKQAPQGGTHARCLDEMW